MALVVFVTGTLRAQDETHIADGLASIATITGETETLELSQDSISVTGDGVPVTGKDSTAVQAPAAVPVWKQKLYYGYNFDIYYHHDSRADRKDNGWSISVEPGLYGRKFGIQKSF